MIFVTPGKSHKLYFHPLKCQNQPTSDIQIKQYHSESGNYNRKKDLGVTVTKEPHIERAYFFQLSQLKTNKQLGFM